MSVKNSSRKLKINFKEYKKKKLSQTIIDLEASEMTDEFEGVSIKVILNQYILD